MTGKSRFIESLLLELPLPQFIARSNKKGILSILDGYQRLRTLNEFVAGDHFELRDLEVVKEVKGLTFSLLPMILQNRILETELTLLMINPSTPVNMIRMIVERLRE